MENCVYHYCSLDTFVKIMTNKTLRSSDCSKTNDSAEIKWLTRSVQKYVEEYILADDELCEHIKMDDSKKTITRDNVDTVLNGVFFKNSRMMFTLVTCFSEAKDLLSQWRGYANDGNGIAIGFSKEHLMTFDSGGYKYHFKKIEYDEELQFDSVKKALNNLINSYKTSEFQEKIFEEFLQDLLVYISCLRNDSPMYKNSSFSEEQEWRLITDVYISDVLNCSKNNDYNELCDIDSVDEDFSISSKLPNGFIRRPVQFAVNKNRIVPYFDLDFSKIRNGFVKEIIIGSKCDISEKDMELFLSASGYEVANLNNGTGIKIIPSKCTYR